MTTAAGPLGIILSLTIAVGAAGASTSPPVDLRPIDPGGSLFEWEAVPGAARYDVVRGDVGQLFDDGAVVHLGISSCVENDSADTTTAAGTEPASPDTALPSIGSAFFYLVRTSDGIADGPFGSGTNGNERQIDYGGCLSEGDPPPEVMVVRPGQPGVEDVLGLRLAAASPDWAVEGTAMAGPLLLVTSGVDGGIYTVRYAGGAVLEDGSGPLAARAIPADGLDPTTIALAGVRFPSRDEDPPTMLEVEVRNPQGIAATTAIALNIDADPPTVPVGFTLDQGPYLGSGGERSGESDLAWGPSTDDGNGGGTVVRYDIRAMCHNRSTCGELDWGPIDNWESRTLIASVAAGITTHHLSSIGLDEDWRIGVRAFDEAGNWSPVSEVGLSTRLVRTVIGTHAGLLTGAVGLMSLGDVNGDGLGDVAVASFGSVTLMLGESDPSSPSIPGNPFSIPPPGGPSYFGSDLSAAGDLNGDGLGDFMVGSFGAFGTGENRVYIFFGSIDTTQLLAPDVTIQGAIDGTSTGLGYYHSGHGNFIDVGGAPPFDDAPLATWDISAGSGTFYVVLGRPAAQWPTTLAIAAGPNREADNCARGIITIPAQNGPVGFPDLEFGLTAGSTTMNEDDWSDLIVSTTYPGAGTSSAQYIFYGSGYSTCPTGFDLGTANEIVLNLGGATSMPFKPSLAVVPTKRSGSGVVLARGYEYLVGLPGIDLVEIHRFNPVAGAVESYSMVSSGNPSGEEFGSAVAYVGNFDQDSAGSIDFAASALSTVSSAGRVYLLLSGSSEPRFAGPATFFLDLPGVTSTFGMYVAGGFDYNGDGYPDLAVADRQSGSIYLFF